MMSAFGKIANSIIFWKWMGIKYALAYIAPPPSTIPSRQHKPPSAPNSAVPSPSGRVKTIPPNSSRINAPRLSVTTRAVLPSTSRLPPSLHACFSPLGRRVIRSVLEWSRSGHSKLNKPNQPNKPSEPSQLSKFSFSIPSIFSKPLVNSSFPVLHFSKKQLQFWLKPRIFKEMFQTDKQSERVIFTRPILGTVKGIGCKDECFGNW